MCLAVPGRIESIYEDRQVLMGVLDFGGVSKEICLAYLPGSSVGDYVIVHAGFAISRIDEESALDTWKTFQELGLLDETFPERQSRP